MNTIQGFQIFSPIGFMMYPCKYTHLCKECDGCDVAQSTGYFDRNNYDIVSFYSRDYVDGECFTGNQKFSDLNLSIKLIVARKKLEFSVPIVRSDRDIANLLNRKNQEVNNVVDIFLASKHSVHLLRAIEPTLRFGSGILKYLDSNPDDELPKCEFFNTTSECRCINLASRKQIGEIVVFQGEKVRKK
jgi:chondroitin polymerizing factor